MQNKKKVKSPVYSLNTLSGHEWAVPIFAALRQDQHFKTTCAISRWKQN